MVGRFVVGPLCGGPAHVAAWGDSWLRRHWVDFRRQHGWGKEEMYDAKGEPIKREQPKPEGKVKARCVLWQARVGRSWSGAGWAIAGQAQGRP